MFSHEHHTGINSNRIPSIKIRYVWYVLIKYDRGKRLNQIFILSQAFDSISHEMLQVKMSYYGFSQVATGGKDSKMHTPQTLWNVASPLPMNFATVQWH